jgi:hypothetical protein
MGPMDGMTEFALWLVTACVLIFFGLLRRKR